VIVFRNAARVRSRNIKLVLAFSGANVMKSKYVVSAQWLHQRLGNEDVAVIDASWYLPVHNRDAKAEYAAAHIPGAVFFDIDKIADASSSLPHMLASPAEFAAIAGAMGISDADTIVVYDGMGLFSSARAWWNFRIMGAKHVFILDGGFPAWKAAGNVVSADLPSPTAKNFRASFNAASVRSKEEVLKILADNSAQLVDARPAERFSGAAPEPRPGLRSGHIPGAKSMPFASFAQDGKLKDVNALKALFEQNGVDVSAPVVASCGSGVSAALVDLALSSIGAPSHAVYDGSWAEWGLPGDTPVAAGES
jgi:thiosulfate/3-mercaptopyruvate sulfurtransferase